MHHHHHRPYIPSHHHYHRPVTPPPPPPSRFSSAPWCPTGDGAGAIAGVVGVVVLIVFFVVFQPNWGRDAAEPPGRMADVGGAAGGLTAESGGLTLTVTKVEADSSHFRIWMTASNGTGD